MSAAGDNISLEAAAARKLLDTTFIHVEKVRADDETAYSNTLQETISLVSSIQYQNDLQTPLVAEALSKVKKVLDRLSPLVERGAMPTDGTIESARFVQHYFM